MFNSTTIFVIEIYEPYFLLEYHSLRWEDLFPNETL